MTASKRRPRAAPARSPAAAPFDVDDYLESSGGTTTVRRYGRGEPVFRQGNAADQVMYIQSGGVKLSTVSEAGREAVVAMLGSGDFFGEGCLAGQPLRMGSATALTASRILLVSKGVMARLLHQQTALSDRFIAHILARNIRIEEDLIDQLFNSSEKRLARALLLLALRTTGEAGPGRAKKLGFIDYDGETPLETNSSLPSVVLHD